VATKRRSSPRKGERQGALTLVLDQASGFLRLTDPEERPRLVGATLLPDAAALLAEAESARRSVRLLVPDPRAEAGAIAELTEHLPIAEALPITDPGELPPPRVEHETFVSADAGYRQAAAGLGYRPVPHPAMAREGTDPEAWLFAALVGPRELFERIAVVPYDLERSADGTWRLLGAIQRAEVRRAEELGLRVQRLAVDIATDDLFLVPAERGTAVGWLDHPVLWRDAGRALVAVNGREAIDGLPLHGAHGHIVAVGPDPGLLRPAPPAADAQASLVAGAWMRAGAKIVLERPPVLDLKVLLPSCPGSAASFQADIDRFSGVTPLDASGTIASRHTGHADNARVVDALVAELQAIGYCAWREPFSWYGQTRYNVIADLPAAGVLQIRPDILERLAKVLVRWPRPDPPDPWIKAMVRLAGPRTRAMESLVPEELLEHQSSWIVRRDLEWRLGLYSWWPWWRLCLRPTAPADLIIVGCHLDSTAGNDPGYNPATGAARGADDDGSGVAGTLALARWMWGLRGTLRHTVRFCFFNGEEQGLIGSKAYASALKAMSAPIRAVVCMDMIGYNSDANRLFEVHAGYTDPAVRDVSVPVANTVASWASSLGALPPAQVYQGTSPFGGPDRTVSDGAINRSDHAAFHQQGYPAVVVTEDFFGNLASEPAADPNPNYHRNADAAVDAGYASEIVCAVGYAVRALAS
jgi:Peptidase family M28